MLGLVLGFGRVSVPSGALASTGCHQPYQVQELPLLSF